MKTAILVSILVSSSTVFAAPTKIGVIRKAINGCYQKLVISTVPQAVKTTGTYYDGNHATFPENDIKASGLDLKAIAIKNILEGTFGTDCVERFGQTLISEINEFQFHKEIWCITAETADHVFSLATPAWSMPGVAYNPTERKEAFNRFGNRVEVDDTVERVYLVVPTSVAADSTKTTMVNMATTQPSVITANIKAYGTCLKAALPGMTEVNL